MSRGGRGYAELAALAGMIREARLAELARARADLAAIEAEVAALDAAAAAARAAALGEGADPRALDRHEAWLTGQRRALMIRLAAARVACEAALARAAPAVGRADVLRTLSRPR
ncbi:hypothetical protein V8J36_18165 [Frigidibacter sp. MR17.14]|uniref:hypothetical protein n=1 Tax=Frigidibacter sp. MR17.14 TaxID=3126509 RepID=UPI003012D14A